MRRWRPGCRCDLRDLAGGRIDNGWPVRPYSVRRFTVSASQSPSRGPWHRIFGTPSVGVDDRDRSGAVGPLAHIPKWTRCVLVRVHGRTGIQGGVGFRRSRHLPAGAGAPGSMRPPLHQTTSALYHAASRSETPSGAGRHPCGPPTAALLGGRGVGIPMSIRVSRKVHPTFGYDAPPLIADVV